MLRFFLEYQWLVDFAVYATGVFLFTECYYNVVDARKEVNIGAIWCVLTVLFSLYPSTVKSLYVMTDKSVNITVLTDPTKQNYLIPQLQSLIN